MKTVPTYTATIYVGLLEYVKPADRPRKRQWSVSEVEHICGKFCDEIGLCVTVTPTTFVYTGGDEPGAIVGLINYPRFPKSQSEIRVEALKLASILATKLGQKRLSVVFPD